MNAPRLNYPAIRALRTALIKSERYEAQLRGMEADHAIDFGEWSSGYHEDALDCIERAIADQIAERFGMFGGELLEEARLAECVESDAVARVHEWQRRIAIVQQIEADWGPRCAEVYVPDEPNGATCPCCDAWAFFDKHGRAPLFEEITTEADRREAERQANIAACAASARSGPDAADRFSLST